MPLPTPTPEQIKRLRKLSGLTQQQAALLVHAHDSAAWRKWESGTYSIPLATWELFLIKTGQLEPRTENQVSTEPRTENRISTEPRTENLDPVTRKNRKPMQPSKAHLKT